MEKFYQESQIAYKVSKEELNKIIDTAVERAMKRLIEKQQKEKFYTKKQAAQLLNIHPSTLSRWISNRIIPDQKLYSYADILEISKKL
jgi:transcriptional regulator with PAS, ATPase and Fis domain